MPTGSVSIAMIAATLPPQRDGVGDYTACLSATLMAEGCAGSVRIYTDKAITFDPIPGVKIDGVFSPGLPNTNWDFLSVVEQDRPDWLIVQYSPFSYGNRGLNLQLPKVLAELKNRHRHMRVTIMFHERYVTGRRWQAALMGIWQRWQFYKLGQAADVILFSVESWALRHAPLFKAKVVEHLPVGSAMPRIVVNRAEARSRLGIAPDEMVLGVFGSAHISRKLDFIRAAAEALLERGKVARVLYIGADGDQVSPSLKNIPAIIDGPHTPQEVSRRLAAVDIYLAPYSDGISTRRSAMMAALQHSLPIVGTFGPSTDSSLLIANGSSILLTSATDSAKFASEVADLADDPRRREQLGIEGRRLFEKCYTWPVIASKLHSILDKAPPRYAKAKVHR